MTSETYTTMTAGPDQKDDSPAPSSEFDGFHPSSSGEDAGKRLKSERSDATGQSLLERFVIGDESALDRLLEAYTPMIFAVFMRRYGLTQEDADDLFQEVLLQLFMKADTIRNVRPWLLGTAFNQARKRVRGLIRDRNLAERYVEEEVLDPKDDGDIKDLVARGLAFAAPADQELLQLIYFDDLSYKEVANRLDRPIGSIGPMRGRALERLKTTIDQLEGRSYEAVPVR